jgi:hypothetical protein
LIFRDIPDFLPGVEAPGSIGRVLQKGSSTTNAESGAQTAHALEKYFTALSASSMCRRRETVL